MWYSRPALRWLVPASAALAVIGGGVAIGALTAAAEPALPARSAAQLLVDLQTARLDGLSGTVVQRADLGLPQLPGLGHGGRGSADLSSLISGTHTLRVWYSGPDKARVALLGTLGESDVIVNGTDLWTWSSRENKATHRTLPAAPEGRTPAHLPALTPQRLADAALAALDPTTRVSTDGSARVAGRDAYELVLAPRDAATLVGSVRLAIDARQHVPLRVRVYARASESPAIEVAFTQVSFDRPDPDQFTFNPPPGASVLEQGTKADARHHGEHADLDLKTVGEGWTRVLVARMPDGIAGDDEGNLAALVGRLPRVSGTWGSGWLLTSTLVSVLLTDDGRVLVGAVAPQRLYQAAAA